jgi:hypothetical protein
MENPAAAGASEKSKALPPFVSKSQLSGQKVKSRGGPRTARYKFLTGYIDRFGTSSRPQINSKALGSQDRTQGRREMEAALVQGCTLTRAKSILSSNRCQNLISLNDRIAEFIVDRFPDEGSPVELLCVDHIGTYVTTVRLSEPGSLDNPWRAIR